MSTPARRRWLVYLFLFVLLATLSTAVLLHAARPPVFVKALAAPLKHLDAPALLTVYCTGCHASGRTRFELDAKPTLASVHQNPAIWKKVVRVLRGEQMPPEDTVTPNTLDRERLITWIEDSLGTVDTARLAARRLGELEYRNAVRDLLGVEAKGAGAPEDGNSQPQGARQVVLPADFPADESHWALYPDEPTVPTDMVGAYQAAAETVLNQLQNQVAIERMSHAERSRAVVNVARRAFRRPLNSEETAHLERHLNDLAGPDASPVKGFRAALGGVLTSPQFLYKIERRPDLDLAGSETQAQFELASRLASFLWSSVPDEELLAEAERGTLTARLDHHVTRMLADTRAQNLAPQFTNYWLRLEELDTVDNVPAALRRAMRAETERFVAHIIQEDRDILEFLNADYTFADETMARHYGIPGISGDDLRPVHHGDSQRRGLLGHASVLTMSTSPMRRGRWILEKLLGKRVPPPPFGMTLINKFPALPPSEVREIVHHRGKVFSCGNYCHAPLVGLGAALENYGISGAWRTEQTFFPGQAPSPVDATGVSPTGEAIAGPAGLSFYLMVEKAEFLRCLSGQLLTFGLGRKLRDSDLTALDQIVEHLEQGDWRFSRVVQQVMASAPFQKGFVERWAISAAER